jgi:hypothetical protein
VPHSHHKFTSSHAYALFKPRTAGIYSICFLLIADEPSLAVSRNGRVYSGVGAALVLVVIVMELA